MKRLFITAIFIGFSFLPSAFAHEDMDISITKPG